MEQEIIIGIDLGTTNSLVSYYDNGQCKIIPNILGGHLTPSVVSVLENDEIVVGETAKERLITYPDRTAAVFKRNMGNAVKTLIGGYEFSPQELSSFIIKSLKNDAERVLGQPIKEAVISVPAYFNDFQRRATMEAGKLAGLKVERLISEPAAAALAYGLHQKDEDIKFLVFDLGGGTFDVSVIDLFEQVLEVQALAGDSFLGGEDFNELIYKNFLTSHQLQEENLDKKVIAHIKKQAELAKIQLSSHPEAKIQCVIDGEEYEMLLTAELLEDLCTPLFDRLRKPLKIALEDAGIKPEELDCVILVGGSTKMQLIRKFAARIFKHYPLSDINPDEIVALGAGIAAAMKARNVELKEHVMTDVCPFTLGIATVRSFANGSFEDDIYFPLIERNTTIPYSYVDRFYTVVDNQEQIRVVVYQGEFRKASNNILLGDLNIAVNRAPRGAEAVDVRFSYDLNGILEVEVTVVSTDQVHRKVIINNDRGMTEEQIQEALKNLEKIKIHPAENIANRLLFERGERLYQETLGNLRREISDRLSEFTKVLNRRDAKEIADYGRNLKQFFDQVENMG